MKDKYLIAFDVESTGLDQKRDGITELGAVKIGLNGKFIDTFDKFSNPGIKISNFIRDFTGITNYMIKDSPKPYIIIEEFFKWVGEPEDCILFAHNSNFDVNIVCYELERNKKPIINYRVTDTLKWSRKKLNFKSNKLPDLAESIGYKPTKIHRAKYDALTTMKLIEHILKNVEKPENEEDLWRLLLSKSEFFLNIFNK